jgi:tetratricopeptide (TPR) repeat protein
MTTKKMCVPGVLCLFSAPLLDPEGKPLTVLDVEAEMDAIKESTANSDIEHLRFCFATNDELLSGVTDCFNIVHLSGHGNEEFLLFEDEKGGSQLLDKNYIKKVFGQTKCTELAVVSACHSEPIARLLIEAGVKYAVAIRQDFPVLDFAAIAFAAKFYAALFKGRSIKNAFDIAKLAVEGDPKWRQAREWLKLEREKKGEPFLEEERKFLLLPDDTHIDPEAGVTLTGPGDAGCKLEGMGTNKTNLPGSRSKSFTGRAKEMHDLVNMVLRERLVTIRGAGGIGKTAIAMEVGRWFHLRNSFKDGIFKMDLRGLEGAESVMQHIATTLGLEFKDETGFFTLLKPLRCLLILDNAEDVIWKDEKGFRRLVNNMLEWAGHTRLLATSQKEIGGALYEKEGVYKLPSLDLQSAVALFMNRLKMSDPSGLKEDDVYKLLRRVGGHPLSIVILAGQVSEGVTISDLLDRLESGHAKAVKGITDMDPSHGESLVICLSSAYERLSQKAKNLFGLLSYFPTGIQRDDMDRILGESCWEFAVQLLDVSLVEISNDTRLSLLPSVRLFSLSVLGDEVKEEYEEKILEFMAGFSQFIRVNYFSDNAPVYKMNFMMEEPNWRYGVEHIERVDSALNLREEVAYNLLALYYYSDLIGEGLRFGERMLETFRAGDSKLGESAVSELFGMLHVQRDNIAEAELNYDHALKIYQAIGNKYREAQALQLLGDLRLRRDNLSEAEENVDHALRIFQEIGDKLGEAQAWRSLGDLRLRRNNLSEAEENVDHALRIFQEVGDKLGEANAWKSLGDLRLRRDNLTEAEENVDHALRIFQEIGDKLGEANAWRSLGDLRSRREDLSEAEENYDHALRIFQEIGSKLGEAIALQLLGDMRLRREDLSEAEENYNHALRIFQEIGSKLGEAIALASIARLSLVKDDLPVVENLLKQSMEIYIEIDEKEGQSYVKEIHALRFLIQKNVPEARHAFRENMDINKEIQNYAEPVGWFLFYAEHLNKKGLKDEASVCLEFAGELADASGSDILKEMVKPPRKDDS